MADEKFKPRSMSIRELAQLYFPDITAESAGRSLRKWLYSDPELSKQLKAHGFIEGNRLLTPRHVELIITRLGEP